MKTRYFILIVLASLLINIKTDAQDTNWVKKNTWYFDNFGRDTLPWSIFRETFIGVAPAPAADFDQLFYSLLYQTKLAGPGHCYGMDVMSMLMKKNGGFLGYCHQPYVYNGSLAGNTNPSGMPSNDTVGPTDRNLRTAIEIVHGYQISHGFLSFLLDVIAKHKNRDGRYAYQQVDYNLAKDDQPIISITGDLSPEKGGHVLIPYFTETIGGTKKIYVYDPNRSWYKSGPTGHDWYTARNNFIEINGTTGAWKYTMCCDTVWAGDPGSGGNLLVIPLSIAGRKDRLPQSLLADGSYAINTITIFGDVKVEQISDLSGKKRYLNANGTDVEPCEENRLTNVMPFMPLDGASPSKGTGRTNAYFFRGSEPVQLRYKAYGNYKIGMIFHGKYYEINGLGKGEEQYFSPEEKYFNPLIKQSSQTN
ncbi:MAG TPA: hypothetical protein VN451_07465 [Chitinophagaceae bacterium]|nr:hypothetical protein [Chitinophagaceae bacterium]